MSFSVSFRNVTSVSTARFFMPSGERMATAVQTWWVRPESFRSMDRASSSSSGLPRGKPSRKTSVSAPMTVESGCSRNTASALAAALCRQSSCGGMEASFSSSVPRTIMEKGMPVFSSNSRRRGDWEARMTGGIMGEKSGHEKQGADFSQAPWMMGCQ